MSRPFAKAPVRLVRASRALVPALLLSGAGVACVEQADDKPTAEDLEYVKQNLLTAAPTPKIAVNADIGGKVVYLGLDAEPTPVQPGQDVKLVHYWKVVEAPGEGWRLFTHVNGPNNTSFINFDHGPVRGKYPVSSWKAGDIVRDEHTIRLPPTWPHDKVMVYTGLWRRAERMPVKTGAQDGGNRLLAAALDTKAKAAPAPLARYVVRKVAKAPKIDGVLDEQAWKEASSTGLFVDTLTGGEGKIKTEAKMLWDDKTLYVAFQNEDKDVWGEFKNRDDKLWQQEAVELMIDPNGDGKSYVELQVSPLGTLFDTYLPTYRKYEDSIDPKAKPFSWNSKMKAAVKVDGTVNKREDEDKGWTVELAIPLADLNGLAKPEDGAAKVPPAYGDVWRLNAYRLDAPSGGGQVAVGWSAPLVGDFHALGRFGEVLFADDKGQIPQPATAEAKPEGDAKDSKKAAKIEAALKGIKEPGGEGERTMKVGGDKKQPASKPAGAPATK